jgi:hypothetical protein
MGQNRFKTRIASELLRIVCESFLTLESKLPRRAFMTALTNREIIAAKSSLAVVTSRAT